MYEGSPDYKSVHYFTAAYDPLPIVDNAWDPNYRMGIWVTGCNSDDDINKHLHQNPSDCFWLIPGVVHDV